MPEANININWKPTFIVGAPRSGTTLLASLLARHSAVCIPPETHFFRSYARRLQDGSIISSNKNRYKKRVSFLLNNVRVHDLSVSETEIMDIYTQYPPDYKYLLISLLAAYAKKQSKAYTIEKTPHHLEYVDDIIKLYPDARIINIIRDGRDVSTSLMEVPWTHKNIDRHAAYWAWCIRACRRFENKYPQNVLSIHFEDLVSSPETSIRQICHFVQLPFENTMLDTKIHVNTVPSWEKQWKDASLEKPVNSKIAQWKNMDLTLISRIQKHMYHELAMYHYPLLPNTKENRLSFRGWKLALFWNKHVFSVRQKISQWIRTLTGKQNTFRTKQIHHQHADQ